MIKKENNKQTKNNAKYSIKIVNKAVQSDSSLKRTRKKAVHAEHLRKREAMAWVSDALRSI